MIETSPLKKKIILGTALWGWGVTRFEAFALLDEFFENGGVIVDTATNYPINKCPDDLGLAVRWLTEWTKLNSNDKYSLIVKIGSKNNMGGPEFDLSPKNIIDTTKKLQDAFEQSLSCISIHWDNRGDVQKDRIEIDQTVDAMLRVRESGLDIGLSGIKNPNIYYLSNPSISDDWYIQVKENFSTNYSRLLYQNYFPNAKFFAYGINMGGIKFDCNNSASSINLRGIKVNSSLLEKLSSILEASRDIDPRFNDINQLSLIFSYYNKFLSGVIIGPRNTAQLRESLNLWADLQGSINQSIWSNFFDQFYN